MKSKFNITTRYCIWFFNTKWAGLHKNKYAGLDKRSELLVAEGCNGKSMHVDHALADWYLHCVSHSLNDGRTYRVLYIMPEGKYPRLTFLCSDWLVIILAKLYVSRSDYAGGPRILSPMHCMYMRIILIFTCAGKRKH